MKQISLKKLLLSNAKADSSNMVFAEKICQCFNEIATRRLNRARALMLLSMWSFIAITNLKGILNGDRFYLILTCGLFILYPFAYYVGGKRLKKLPLEKKMQQASQFEALLSLLIVALIGFGLFVVLIKSGIISKPKLRID